MNNYTQLPEETLENTLKTETPKKTAPLDPFLSQSHQNSLQNIIEQHEEKQEKLKSQNILQPSQSQQGLPPEAPKLALNTLTQKKVQNMANRFKKALKNDEGKKIDEICLELNQQIIEPLAFLEGKELDYAKIHEKILTEIIEEPRIAPSLYLDVGKAVKGLVMTSDASELVSLTIDGSLQFVDLMKQTISEPKTFQKNVDAMILTPDDEKLILANAENIVIMDFKKKIPMRNIPHRLNSEHKENMSNFNKSNTKLHEAHKKSLEKSPFPQKMLEKIAILAYDPKASLVLSVSNMAYSHRIGVFDLKDSKESKNPQKSQFFYLISKDSNDPIKSLVVFPNGAQLASGTFSGKINIWILTKKEEVNCLLSHEKSVTALVVSQDGSQIISGSDDMKIILWKSKKNPINFEITTILNAESQIVSLIMSPDGSNLISGTKRRVLAWNLRSTQKICAFDGAGTSVLSSDGNKLCSPGKQNTIRIWELNDKSMSSCSLKSPKCDGEITRIWLHAEKKLAIASGMDQRIKTWELEEGYMSGVIENIGKMDQINPFGVMRDGMLIVGLSKEGAHIIEIMNSNTGETMGLLKGHKYGIVDIIVNKEEVIYSISEDGKMLRWDNIEKKNIILNEIDNKDKEPIIEKFQYKSQELGTQKASILACYYEGLSCFLVSGGKDGSLRIWNNKPSQPKKEHSDQITSLIFHPDYKTMFSAGLDLKIIIWDVIKWESKQMISTKDIGIIRALGLIEFNQSSRLLSGGEDKTLRIWDYENSNVLHSFENHQESVITCIWADKTLIMTGGADSSIKILKKRENREDVKEEDFDDFPLEKYVETINSYQILKGTSQIIIAKGKNLHILDLETGKNVQFFPLKHIYDIEFMALNEDNKIIVTGEQSYQEKDNKKIAKLFVWDIETRRLITEKSLEDYPQKIEIYKNSLFVAMNFQPEKNKSIYLSKIEKRWLKKDVDLKVLKSFQSPNLNKINSFKIYGKAPNLMLAVAGEKIHNEKNVIKARHGAIFILEDGVSDKDVFQCHKKMGTKEDIPMLLEILPDKTDNFLISANENKAITIWDLFNESRVMRILGDSEIRSFSFIPLISEKQRLLGFINGSLFDFESNKFLRINKWVKDKKPLIFHLKNTEYISMNKDFVIEKYNNLFCSKNLLEVLASVNSLKDFFLSIIKPQNQEIYQGNEAFFPYYFNFMHCVALSGIKTIINNKEYASPFIIEDLTILKPDLDVFLAKDACKNTCFDILIKLNNKELFQEFINVLLRELDERKFLMFDKIKFFSNKKKNILGADFLILVKAFEFFGSQILEQLLNHAIIDYDNFAHGIMLPEIETPIFLIRKNLHRIGSEELKEILKKKMEERSGIMQKVIKKIKSYDKNELENDHEVFSRVKCKIICLENLVEINDQVISFMDKINALDPKNKIFCNKVINIMANYKWDAYAFNLNLRQFLLFVFFFAMYCFNFFYIFPERLSNEIEGFTFMKLVSFFFDFNVFLFMIYYSYLEWQEFLSKKLSYIESGYNWIDIGLIIMAFSALALDFLLIFDVYGDLSLIKQCIALSIFLFWLRVIIFLRGVNGTAFMISLIVQVITDIRYFLLLIFLFLLSFDSSAYFLQKSYNSDNSFTFFGIFTVFYRLLLGDYTQYDDIETEDDNFLWFLMVAFTVLTVIILLNLLISIISDSFGKVFNAKTQARTYELLSLINSVDRSLNEKKRQELREQEKIGNYLFIFYNTIEENEIDVAMETFNAMKRIEQKMMKNSDVETIVSNNLQSFYVKIKDLIENSKKAKDDQKGKKTKE